MKAPKAKPLKGFGGAGVLEVVANYDGNTFRAVYTVKFAEAVFVLHAFQKKSKHDIAMPKSDLEVIKRRLRVAATEYLTALSERQAMTKEASHRSSGNVFADLQIRNPGQYLAKAELAAKILAIVQQRGMTQAATGRLLGINQPKVSALLNGRLDGFSSDRLFRFLNALGCDVRISVSRPHPKSRGQVRVLAG